MNTVLPAETRSLGGTVERTYERTHPWINFRLDLSKLPYTVWMLLGEAISKIEHISGVPLEPEVAKSLSLIYLSKGAHATTHIEGNTLSEEEVLQRVQDPKPLPPSRAYLGQEIDNILTGYNVIIADVIHGRDLTLSTERILLFNEIVLKDLPPEEGVVPGKIREDSVLVGTAYRGAPAGECRYLLDRLCTWLNALATEAPEHLKQPVAVLSALLAHLYIAWIHPFGNGNGRTARLIEFQLLMAGHAPTVAGHVLSDHYNRTRSEYYRHLALTSREPYEHNLNAFVEYGLQGMVDGLREQIDVIREQQLRVTWRDYVNKEFDDSTTPACLRQRRVALELPWSDETPIQEIPTLTPRLALDYATKGERTAPRDVNALVRRGLVIKRGRKVSPDIDQIRAFLPPRIQPD